MTMTARELLAPEIAYAARHIPQTELARALGVTRQRIGQLYQTMQDPLQHHLTVVGGQFGSEGKGRVVEWLLRASAWTASVRVGGPQAGHTVEDTRTEGATYAFRSLPVSVAAVHHGPHSAIIGAGAVVDLEVLARECRDWGNGDVEIYLDQEAVVVGEGDRQHEAALDLANTTGSTGKGVGAARSAHVLRRQKLIRDLPWGDLPPEVTVLDTRELVRKHWYEGKILFEGAQGLGLSLRSRYYPHVTSADCTTIQMFSDAGVTGPMVRDRLHYTLGVYRTYPIRIAGPSGPLYDELTWDQVGVEPEITTVTKKVRRVGGWDAELARWSTRFGGVDLAALTFLDYLDPSEWQSFCAQAQADLGVPLWLVAAGPGAIEQYRDVAWL